MNTLLGIFMDFDVFMFIAQESFVILQHLWSGQLLTLLSCLFLSLFLSQEKGKTLNFPFQLSLIIMPTLPLLSLVLKFHYKFKLQCNCLFICLLGTGIFSMSLSKLRRVHFDASFLVDRNSD